MQHKILKENCGETNRIGKKRDKPRNQHLGLLGIITEWEKENKTQDSIPTVTWNQHQAIGENSFSDFINQDKCHNTELWCL